MVKGLEDLDLYILEKFVNATQDRNFINKFKYYQESINCLQYDNLDTEELEHYQNIKEETESLFTEHGIQKIIDEINERNLKILNKKILNEIEIFEEPTEEILLAKVEAFFHKIIEKTNKNIDPNYGSVRATVDGFKIQISYRLVD